MAFDRHELGAGRAQPAGLAGEIPGAWIETRGAAAPCHALHLGLFVRIKVNRELCVLFNGEAQVTGDWRASHAGVIP
jgi:hypothetical protein